MNNRRISNLLLTAYFPFHASAHRLSFVILCIFLIPLATSAQNCQGSFDQQDIEGEGMQFHHEYRCGTSIMEEQMHFERIQREKSGYFDIKGFAFYGDAGFYQKKGKLYFSAHPDTFILVPNGDIASLKYAGNFIRDKNFVYYNGKPQFNVNVKKFKPLSDTPYAMDDSLVYYNRSKTDQGISGGITILEGANPKFFQPLCESESNGSCYYYAKDNNHVYFSGELIPEADAATFRLDDYGYAHDSNFAYYNGQKLEGSSGKTLVRVDYYYTKDENNVYNYGTTIPGMNGKNFRLIGESGMGTDEVSICFGAVVFDKGDPSTLVDLGCGYYKDVNNVYSKGQILNTMDAASFEILAYGFAKDKNGVYCDDVIIPEADPASFEVLGRKYSRDKERVFYLRTSVEDCERASFKVDIQDSNIGEDAKATYFRGKRSLK